MITYVVYSDIWLKKTTEIKWRRETKNIIYLDIGIDCRCYCE